MKMSEHHVVVYWGDTDPAAIVYYPKYFAWFDQGTMALFQSAGYGWDALTKKLGVVGVPIVEAKARFVAPCRFQDSLIVQSRITRWTSKTFQISHTILNRGSPAVEGYEVRALCKAHPDDASRLKAFTIPAQFKQAFD